MRQLRALLEVLQRDGQPALRTSCWWLCPGKRPPKVGGGQACGEESWMHLRDIPVELGVHSWARCLLGQLHGAAGTKWHGVRLRPQRRVVSWSGGPFKMQPRQGYSLWQLKQESAPALRLGVWTLSHPPVLRPPSLCAAYGQVSPS